MRVYVLSDNAEQFSDWCARQRVNPLAATCVLDPLEILGKLEPESRVVDLRATTRWASPIRDQASSYTYA